MLLCRARKRHRRSENATNDTLLFKEPSLVSARTPWSSPVEISRSRMGTQACSPVVVVSKGTVGSDLCPAPAAGHLIEGLSYVRAQIISSFCSVVLKSVDR